MNVNDSPGKVWILAGEASGDLYGARLAAALLRQRPGLRLEGMGGAAMREAGVHLHLDATDLGVVGLFEVLRHLLKFWRLFHALVAQAEVARPDLVVLIDYPGFNLRFARAMNRRGIPVLYYISPQVWAWGRRRIPVMARMLRRILVIFPFEQPLWEQAGLACQFVGHPLLEILAPLTATPAVRDPNLVLLLPGSRRSEVDRLLQPLLRTAVALRQRQPACRFVLPTPGPAIRDRVTMLLSRLPEAAGLPVEVVCGETAEWMRRATAGIAASGTVTVQAAILGLPLVVAYRLHPLTYLLGRVLVKVPYITMVNLVAGERVFEEFIQGQVRPEVLAPALERILPGGARRDEVLAGMAKAVAALGTGAAASEQAASAILAELEGARPPPATA